MIPQLVTVRYQGKPHKRHTFWIPLLPFYLLFTPFLPLIIIGGVIACARYRINPVHALVALSRLLASLGGLHIHITEGTTNVQIKLT